MELNLTTEQKGEIKDAAAFIEANKWAFDGIQEGEKFIDAQAVWSKFVFNNQKLLVELVTGIGASLK